MAVGVIGPQGRRRLSRRLRSAPPSAGVCSDATQTRGVDERRRAVRLEKTLEAILELEEGPQRIFIVDLSVSGARAMTRSQLKPGERFSMELNLGELVAAPDGNLVRTGETVATGGTVVWQRSSPNLKRSFAIGCSFENLEPEASKKIDAYVSGRIDAGDQEVSEAVDQPPQNASDEVESPDEDDESVGATKNGPGDAAGSDDDR